MSALQDGKQENLWAAAGASPAGPAPGAAAPVGPVVGAAGAVPASAVAGYQELAAAAARMLAAGRRLDRHEEKALRLAALLEAGQYLWPDRAACAKDLGLSMKALERLIVRGLPAPPHSPIAKAPVFAWLWRDAAATPGGKDVTDHKAAQVEAEARLKQAKAAKLEGELEQQALDVATRALAEVLQPLKQALLYRAPAELWELAHGVERATAEPVLRRYLAGLLTELAQRAGALPDDEHEEGEAP